MAEYAISFDLDNRSMNSDGLTKSQITKVYQTEIPEALRESGFLVHIQGSLYHTLSEDESLISVMQLARILKEKAPNFCKYVRRCHVFRIEEWSDVRSLLNENGDHSIPLSEDD